MSNPNTNETFQTRDLAAEREKLIGNIPNALDALPAGSSVAIEHITTRDGDSLGINVTNQHVEITRASRARKHPRDEVLIIDGNLTNETGEKSATFPMYKVMRIIPGTDSGYQSPHFDISVADGEAGYTPVALVMQSILDRQDETIYRGSPRTSVHGGVFDESVAQLSPEALSELQETGLYVNPDAQAQLDEVNSILDLIAAQAKVSPDQPTLPLSFVAAA